MMTSAMSTENSLVEGIQHDCHSSGTTSEFESPLDCFEHLSGKLSEQQRNSTSFLAELGNTDLQKSTSKSPRKDSGTISSDNDIEGNTVNLESLSSLQQSMPGACSSSIDMAIVKAGDFQGYPFSKPSGIPDLNFYSDSTLGSVNNSIICDTTDSMFDDAFSLDEFMFSESDRNWNHGRTGYATYLQDRTVTNITTCEADSEQNTHSLLNILNEDEEVSLKTKLQPLSHPTGLPPFHEIRNRTFSDLLRCDSGMNRTDDSNVQNFPSCRDITRARDYSISSDSGVGSSILMDSTSSPQSNQTSERSPQGHAGENIKYELSRPDGYPSHISNYSRKLSTENFEASDFLLEDNLTSLDDSSSPTGEKISSKKTAYNEKWGVKVLKAWCVEMNIPEDFEKLGPDEFNNLLCRFWTEVRKSNGDYYGRNSLFNLRAMINKHLKGKPYCVTFDIVTDERFRSSNDTLEKQLKMLKGIGKTITHKQPISITDLRKMYDSNVLGTSNPLSLLRKVWFEITLHFCHKGSEPQEKLLRTSFQVCRDHSFRSYVSRVPKGKCVNEEEVRMYETGGELCPVQSYQMYLRKLHPLQVRLFQQPRRKSTASSPMWYGKAPIGEKALQQMMANISVAAKLSKRYTNHCVRTTALEQFSNSRRGKMGAKNQGEKSAHKVLASATKNINEKNNSCYIQPGYLPPHSQYGCGPGQTVHPQNPITPYQYTAESYHVSNIHNKHVGGLNHLTRPPSPIKTTISDAITGLGNQCYKRPMSVAFPESTPSHNKLHNSLPPPPYSGQSAKRPRLEACQVFLTQKGNEQASYGTPSNDYVNQQYQNYSRDMRGIDGQIHVTRNDCDVTASMVGMMNPRNNLSETIVAGSNMPCVQTTQVSTYTMLPNVV